jgi:hypothetical protein
VDSKKMTIANALQMLQAKTVILMPGLSDVSGHSQSDLIKSIMLTIYQIRKENPGIQIILQSIPPGMAQKPGKPDNFEIFRYNLAVYKFSLQHSIPFIDTAFALRDSEGNLSRDLCIDPDTLKYHLNDKGCQLWIDYLQLHWPL